ncbi:MAG TPA: hypothetical protein VGP07_24455 [Polyangia bacterium]|jgi:hypothetical protein
MKRWAVAGALLGLASGAARAQAPASVPPEYRDAVPATQASAPPLPELTAASVTTAGEDVADQPADASTVDDLVAQQIRQNEELVANSHKALTWSGYVDFGFFAPEGDGSGYVQDIGHARYPKLSNYNWVFLGDILAPAVNSRGEVADLGTAPGVDRFDSIHSRGAPGFIVNEVNLRLAARPASNAIITTSLNFTPRTGSNFSLGDVFDVDLAQLEWLPTASQRMSIFVGKMESVLGIEYRDRKSDHRFGVTPSLIARYTTGTALGVKVRSKLGEDDWLVIAAAVTNGSNTTEQFHFYDEVDSNAGKTGSARLSVRLPLPFSLEVGFSGSYGAQDRTTSNANAMWFFGPDLMAELGPVALKAAWLRGRSPGDPTQDVYQLDLHGGGYLEADVMLTPSFGLLGRIEYRDAFVALDPERAYLTKSWRATGGGRWVMTRWATLKAEYLYNGEYGGIPQVRNNVFTSSLVLSY